MRSVPLRRDWHRYMWSSPSPTLRLTSRAVPLTTTRRTVQFTWRRIPIGCSTCFRLFQLRFGRKPMMFFGILGAVLFSIGSPRGGGAGLRFGYVIGSGRESLPPLLT